MEARLLVASHKLATYERLETELDKAVERFGSLQNGEDFPTKHFHITDNDGVSTLPTLASRRLEHCIQLSRQIAQLEEIRRSLLTENTKLKAELEVVYLKIPCFCKIMARSGML